MRGNSVAGRLTVVAATMSILVAGLSGCSGFGGTHHSDPFPRSTYAGRTAVTAAGSARLDLGAGGLLTLPSGAARRGVIVSVTSNDPPSSWNAARRPLRAPVHLAMSSGPLQRAATLSFPYDPALVPRGVSPADAFGIATYDPARKVWVDQPVRVDAARHLIITTAAHFSWWEPWGWDWTGLGARVSQDTLSLLGKRVSPPRCDSGALPSFVQNVVTESDTSDPLYSCAESHGGELEVKLVDNRNYGDVLTFGSRGASGSYDTDSLVDRLAAQVVGPRVGAGKLYVPPLSGATVEIPDSAFSVATYAGAPTRGTLLADIIVLAFGHVDLTAVGTGLSTTIVTACGQFASGASLPTSLPAVLGLVQGSSTCLAKVVTALAHSRALDGATLSELESAAGTLTFLEHLNAVGLGVDLGAEIGDLVVGSTSDRGLRQFTVYHAPIPRATPTIPPATVPPVTVPPNAPPTTSSAGGTAVGDHFDDYCEIAWPTAPTYTSSAIEMTMSCEHVSEGQYLFTDVVYDDPGLRPTPSTGEMHVEGTVVDVSHSDFGYSELVVQASSVTF